MRIPNPLRLLLARLSDNQESAHSDDTQRPSNHTAPYSQSVGNYHYVTAYEVQRRATEQHYWKEQLRLAKKLNRLTGKLNCITIWGIIATFVSLLLLWGTLRVTIKNAQLDQRAWVGAVRVRESEITTDVPLRLGVVIKGGGKTPATNVKIRTAWSVIPRDKEFCPSYKNNPVSILDSRAVIFPDMEMNFDTAADYLPQGTLIQMTTGNVMLYHYGAIDYDDVFTPPTAHCTTFCYVYTGDLKTPQICDTYNQVTDAKCEIGCPATPEGLRVE